MTQSDIIMKHVAEYDYIVSIDYRNPGASFNNDTQCFKRYCTMQADTAIKEGCTTIGQDILKLVGAI